MTDETSDVIHPVTGQQWVYSDIARDHFFNPRNFIVNEPKDGEFDGVGMVGSPACLTADSQIHTNTGTKAIGSISIGEKVLDHTGNYSKIKRVFRTQHNAKSLIKIKNQLGELQATPEHLVYAIALKRSPSYFMHTYDKKKTPPSWMHAGDIKRGDILLYPIPKMIVAKESIALPQTKKKYDFKSQALPNIVKIDLDLLEFIGYFVAEGHTKETEAGFTFGETEMDYVQRVVEIAKKIFGLNAVYKIRPDRHRIDINIYNVHLAKFLRENCGKLAQNKKAPDFILDLPPKLQAAFLRGLWRGDGYFDTKRTWPRAVFATTSPTLVNQVKFLLLRQKIVPSMYREPANERKGVKHKPSYRIHVGDMNSLEKLTNILGINFKRDTKKRHATESWFDDDYLYLSVRKVNKIAFSGGKLFNFEVEKTHTYATDAFLVHNCGDVMRIWIKVNKKTKKITAMKWKTFGCASAIAATSMFSVMITENGGRTIKQALKITSQDITKRLGGLPTRKIHCSVLADQAFKKAVADYLHHADQRTRAIVD